MTSSRFHGRGTMPRPRERVYTLDKQKKHLARLSLLSAKRFRFNVRGQRTRHLVAGTLDPLVGILFFQTGIAHDAIQCHPPL